MNHWSKGWFYQTMLHFVGFEAFAAVPMKSSVFLDIKPCSPVKFSQHFGRTYHLHLQGRRSKKPAGWHFSSRAHSHAMIQLRTWSWNKRPEITQREEKMEPTIAVLWVLHCSLDFKCPAVCYFFFHNGGNKILCTCLQLKLKSQRYLKGRVFIKQPRYREL
jgi:hypothetical protein